MIRILHVSASTREASSRSRIAADMVLARLRESHPDQSIVERDLAARPLPHPDVGFVEATALPPKAHTEQHAHSLALSENLIRELELSDLLLISTPMHNFTVPSVLKAWVDHVVRPYRTFQLSPEGKIGLLRPRPVLVISACGGGFMDDMPGETPRTTGKQKDFLTSYLRYVLAVIGLTQVQILRLEHQNAPGAGDITDEINNWADQVLDQLEL
ncbi:(acyl-carrier protein) phosphodiesterase [Alcanivorax balearicus MACL04]|uniref:FMN dependent NADH:quinone oxidoreductase n=1 Tax=Alloalcanivorax balearicus MACL04 TaxID=1177182 RepID=A0ABT2QZF6_9GAMM|nr:NAD(P)H-dependent oxidoreductase [Alloalcanivorax balearicus]MCU5782886.1 (acyl-carrier protein) phosphodiesterase [Alloalcanivorax balearicus MACL04]